MSPARPLRVAVADLLGRPGEPRPFALDLPLDGLALTSAQVPPGADVHVDLVLEAVLGGLTVRGEVRAPFVGECRRCLDPVEGEVEAEVHEVFADDPTDPDLLPIEGDHVDLEPVVREAVLLALPLAPLCRADCPGPDPERFPTLVEEDGEAPDPDGPAPGPPGDPRWAALDQLRLDD